VHAAQNELRTAGLDGWLLYDLEARNRIAAELLGLPEGISRRYFVLLRPGSPPAALAHQIELGHWEQWEGELEAYVGWEEMEAKLGRMLNGCDRVAMEVSDRDAVPFVDNVPAGVVDLIESLGPTVTSSAGLLANTYAQWGQQGLDLHRRAATILADVARTAYEGAVRGVRKGERITELEVADGVVAELGRLGLEGGGVIVATGANSASPHYMPSGGEGGRLTSGGVLLIDLWGRVSGEPAAVFADQTWMGVLGVELPVGFMEAWEAVRAARDGAVRFISDRIAAGDAPTGAEVDAHARKILIECGYEDYLLHRTGHGMDRVNHGFGPNLDSVETRDDRRLVTGIGFSVEPGVYLPDRWGIRSEINVYLGADGPEVSPSAPQLMPWVADD